MDDIAAARGYAAAARATGGHRPRGFGAAQAAEDGAMDLTYLLLLAIAIVVAIGAAAVIRDRIHRESPNAAAVESPFAVSTEGMKTCPNCGMGNLWTDRTCMSCKAPLKG